MSRTESSIFLFVCLEKICCFCYDGNTKGKAPIGRLLLHTLIDLTARVGSRAVISFLLLMCSVLLIVVASFRFSARFEVEEVVRSNPVIPIIFGIGISVREYGGFSRE